MKQTDFTLNSKLMNLFRKNNNVAVEELEVVAEGESQITSAYILKISEFGIIFKSFNCVKQEEGVFFAPYGAILSYELGDVAQEFRPPYSE